MKAWRIFLVVYLLLAGVYWLAPHLFTFPFQGILMGALAIITAVLLLTDR